MDRPNIIRGLLRSGSRTATELCQRLEITQPTLQRELVASTMRDVISMGRARATRYGLLRPLREGLNPERIPIHAVHGTAAITLIGQLCPIYPSGYWFEDALDARHSQYSPDLPWFMQDLRPQGYLGRNMVRALSTRGYPSDIRLWSADDVLHALCNTPEHDHIGNLLVGNVAAQLFTSESSKASRLAMSQDQVTRLAAYRQTVEALGTGAIAGTLAAGEQPKFIARVFGDNGTTIRSLIVKFSAPLSTEAGQRWADLLLMEATALSCVREILGVPAATAFWLTDGTRAYLEVERFDRVGAFGRNGVISLSTLDAEFVGAGSGWAGVVDALVLEERLTPESAHLVAMLEGFSRLIGNTDRHLGNLSAMFGGVFPASLSPAYDVLPMIYAPTPENTYSGALGRGYLLAQFEALDSLSQEDRALVESAAVQYWTQCAQDERLSESMRSYSRENGANLTSVGQGRGHA